MNVIAQNTVAKVYKKGGVAKEIVLFYVFFAVLFVYVRIY